MHASAGPAPESITDKIYEHTVKISEYKIAELPEVRHHYHPHTHTLNTHQVDLDHIASHKWEGFEVDVIDSVSDYLELLQHIFNFPLLRQLLQRPDFHIVYDSMSGVTGPYALATSLVCESCVWLACIVCLYIGAHSY